MTAFSLVAVFFFLLSISIIAAVWVFQERIAFQPELPPYPEAITASRVDYTASDGQGLFAYVIGEPARADVLLLAFHGNADLAVRQIPWAQEVVRRTGIAVMLPEYRGYMGLGGRPTYQGSQLDAEAAYNFGRDHFKTPEGRFTFFGHSLGSAIAVELALEHPPGALVLVAPFTSARDMAALVAGRWPIDLIWTFISRLHFETVAAATRLDVRISVAHGGRDHIVPPAMGRAVFDASRVKGAWLLVPDASHNDVPECGGEKYWNWLADALGPRTA